MACNREETRKPIAESEQKMRSKESKAKEKVMAASQDEDDLLLW